MCHKDILLRSTCQRYTSCQVESFPPGKVEVRDVCVCVCCWGCECICADEFLHQHALIVCLTEHYVD